MADRGEREVVSMLNTMARMQEEHNEQVHPDWRHAGYAYYRAIWVECAEMLDHFGWKWWKQQEPDAGQVKLELVDIWHFALSELLRSGRLTDRVGIELSEVVLGEGDPEAFRQAIERLAESVLSTGSFSLEPFKQTMRTLPLSYDELFSLYIGKNVLNQFRQNNGYKTGSYRKLWAEREDNEHLIELLTDMSTTDAEALPEKLYAALEARYRQTAP